MPGKKYTAYISDFIRMYKSGLTPEEIGRQLGIKGETVSKYLKEAGIEPVKKAWNRNETIPIETVISLYQSGTSELALAKKFHVSRIVIRRIFTENHIPTRSFSDAQRFRNANMTKEERMANTEAAHIAARGRKATFAEKRKRAMTIFERGVHVSPCEIDAMNALRKKGLDSQNQFPVGIYNIDIAIDSFPIAVEIYGGNWHSHRTRKNGHFKRTKYILNKGWNVIIVWVDTKAEVSWSGVADYIVKTAQFLRRNPSTTRQYRVIRSDGKPAPRTSSYFNDDASIKALGACQ